MNDFTDLSGQTQLVFKDTTIRATYDEKGTPVFCAKDVATVLGYADAVNAIKQHCRGVAFHHPIVDSLGRTQKARFIGEGDMYRLIAHSKLPSAVEFEKWVFEEVLPSLRKHGGYLTPEKLEEALLNPDTLIQLATQLKEERQRRMALESENTVLAPKASAWDVFLNSDGDMSVADAAHALTKRIQEENGTENIGRNQLFEKMREYHWATHCHGYWEPMQYALNQGYLVARENMPMWKPNGKSFLPHPTIRVTARGLDRLWLKLNKHDLPEVA